VLLKISLLERANGDCIFFSPAGCRIYAARPAQCKNFPFWDSNLKSPSAWEALKTECPGCGQGPVRSLAEIEDIRAGKRTT